MAQEFLARVLTLENSVMSKGSQDCIICRERCGTLSPETGIMELEIRLPCSHTVGSACIATWLASNNTCPLCRCEFFPRQPRPYMEHEVMQFAEDETVRRIPGEDDEDFLARLTTTLSESQDNPLAFAILYSQSLQLGPSVAFLALNVANAAEAVSPPDASAESIGAASVYVASHILNQPRTLTDVSVLTAVSEREIFSMYDLIYSNRYELIDEDWRNIVGGTTLGEAAEALPTLTWPPLHHFLTNGEISERISVSADSIEDSLSHELAIDLCCEWLYNNTYEGHLDRPIWPMARRIAIRMNRMPLDVGTLNPWTIAAASTYMASFLLTQDKTIDEVSAMAGVPSAWVHCAYRVMYHAREEMVLEDWFMPSWTKAEALTCLPEP